MIGMKRGLSPCYYLIQRWLSFESCYLKRWRSLDFLSNLFQWLLRWSWPLQRWTFHSVTIRRFQYHFNVKYDQCMDILTDWLYFIRIKIGYNSISQYRVPSWMLHAWKNGYLRHTMSHLIQTVKIPVTVIAKGLPENVSQTSSFSLLIDKISWIGHQAT